MWTKSPKFQTPSDPALLILALAEFKSLPIAQRLSLKFPNSIRTHYNEIVKTATKEREHEAKPSTKSGHDNINNSLEIYNITLDTWTAVKAYVGRFVSRGSYSDYRLVFGAQSSFIYLDDNDVEQLTLSQPLSSKSVKDQDLFTHLSSEFIVMHELGHTILSAYLGKIKAQEIGIQNSPSSLDHDLGTKFYYNHYTERYADTYALLSLAQRYPLEQLHPIYSAIVDFRATKADGEHTTHEAIMPALQLIHSLSPEQRSGLTPETKAILADLIIVRHLQHLEGAVNSELQPLRHPDHARAFLDRIALENPDPHRFPASEWERMILWNALQRVDTTTSTRATVDYLQDPDSPASPQVRTLLNDPDGAQWVRATETSIQHLNHWLTTAPIRDQLNGGLKIRISKTADLLSVASLEALGDPNVKPPLGHFTPWIATQLAPNPKLPYVAWVDPNTKGWLYLAHCLEERLGVINPTRSLVQSYNPVRYAEVEHQYQAWLPKNQEESLARIVFEPRRLKIKLNTPLQHSSTEPKPLQEGVLPDLSSLKSHSTGESSLTIKPNIKL